MSNVPLSIKSPYDQKSKLRDVNTISWRLGVYCCKCKGSLRYENRIKDSLAICKGFKERVVALRLGVVFHQFQTFLIYNKIALQNRFSTVTILNYIIRNMDIIITFDLLNTIHVYIYSGFKTFIGFIYNLCRFR